MKTAYFSKIGKFIPAAILSAGLCFVSPAQSSSWIVNANGEGLKLLGNLGRQNSTVARDINDAGRVVGWSQTADFSGHAFITGPNGVGITDLGTLGESFSSANEINSAGQVAGNVSSNPPASNLRAFITGPNGVGMTALGTLGERFSTANGINAAGQVVGTVSTGSIRRAFITGPNGVGMTDIGTLGGNDTEALGINDAGQVVGYSRTADGSRHAFITGANGVGITDLFSLRIESAALAINNAGQVVGTYGPALGRAFITGPNGVGVTDLGDLGGSRTIVNDINDAGQVVGESDTAGGESHAFITGPNGVGMTDLNSLINPDGIFFNSASGINNMGQVIIITSAVPEPATYALMLAGLALVGGMARCRKVGGRRAG